MMESNAGTILVHTVPPEICHVVFPAGFGVGSQQSLIFVRCNNYIGESCDDPLGATARNSVCRTSTCSQNFARVSARLFSILPAPERGSKMAAKIGVRKAKFYFRRHSFGSHFRPLLSVPTSEPEMRKLLDKAHEILEAGTQPSSQPGPAVTSHHSGPFPQDLRCSCQ